MSTKEQAISTKEVVIMGLLIAVSIVLSRFLSIPAWNFKIGFAFLPIALGAILLGPIQGAFIGAVADFIGAILFPIGAYFPGFTLTAGLVGMTYGLLLHRNQIKKNIILAVVLVQFLGTVLLNSFWIATLYGVSFAVLLPTRLTQACIMSVVEVICISMIVKYLPELRRMIR